MLKVLGTSRPPFLVLGPVCVLLAAAISYAVTSGIHPVRLILILIAAVSAHVSVNALNEYSDFRSGLDARTEPTPFSGGSGTLVQNPHLHTQALWLGLIALGIAMVIGLYLILTVGAMLLPIGVLGLLMVLLYTDFITRWPLLCLIAAGTGFGPVMVWGSAVALSASPMPQALWASLPVFFAVNNLLLLNQIPDMEADQTVGRRTFPMVYGLTATARTYGLFVAAGGASLILAVVAGGLPTGALAGLAAIALAAFVATRLRAAVMERERLLPLLALNVLACVSLPALMAAGLLILV